MHVSVSQNCSGRKTEALLARLTFVLAIGCLFAGSTPARAQQATSAAPGLPAEPVPNYTQPLYLRPTAHDFSKARGYFPNLIAPYTPITLRPPDFSNPVQLRDLVQDGKIHLSLSDAVLLALQNNYDIAVQRLNLEIADTDILRTRAGQTPLGTPTALETNTLGGTGTAVTSSGAPAGSSVSGTGVGGLAVSTLGAGPTPENLDPSLQATIELNRAILPQQNPIFSGGQLAISQNTNTYNFTYAQGFVTGTNMQVTFDNERLTTDNSFYPFSPTLQSSFNFSLTQHLLQGFGWGINRRFIVQALNDRRIADSVFRSQLLYTINQVEDIYWGLVSAYEDVQSKQRALDQSTSLEQDDQKQLQIGTMAPLDVVNAKSQVSTDQQALIASESNLEYQELLMKQAIARNLDDPAIANAPVVPTDRVNLAETPEERMSTDDLVRQADANSPAIEQAILNLNNDKITLKAVKNGLLPTLDVQAFYGAEGIGGAVSPYCGTSGSSFFPPSLCAALAPYAAGYGTVTKDLFNSTGPNKGVMFNLNIPIRNRPAQAEQARSEIEYQQAEMRLQQLYVQIRMQVINDQYALTNDRAAVNAAEASQQYNQQSLDADIKKLHLGAATTADVLQQQRNLAAAQAQLISARASYAIARAALEEALSSTLDRYGISIVESANGQIHTQPTIPGIEPAQSEPEVTPPTQKQELKQQEQNPQPQPQTPQAPQS